MQQIDSRMVLHQVIYNTQDMIETHTTELLDQVAEIHSGFLSGLRT